MLQEIVNSMLNDEHNWAQEVEMKKILVVILIVSVLTVIVGILELAKVNEPKSVNAQSVAAIVAADLAPEIPPPPPVTRSTAAAQALLPSVVALPLPAATFVRIMPGCLWGNGTKSLSITRHVNQGFNVVNLDRAQHRMTQISGLIVPNNLGYMQLNGARAYIFSRATVATLTTCSGTLRLIVKVS